MAVWYARSNDLPLRDPIRGSAGADYDAFVSELSADSSELLFSTYLAGSAFDGIVDCGIGTSGQLVVAGSTASNDFPLGLATGGGRAGEPDIFVIQIAGDPPVLESSRFWGGRASDVAGGLAIDGSGNAYIAGKTYSFDFPTTPWAVQPSRAGIVSFDTGFVSKVRLSDGALLYSTYLGGDPPLGDYPGPIVVDAEGYAYVTGETSSPTFPIVRAVQSAYRGGLVDAFVTKLDPTGSRFIYSTFLGGRFPEGGQAILLGALGRVHIVGDTNSPDFPLVDPIQTRPPDDSGNVFIATLYDPVVPSPGDCNEDERTTLAELVEGIAAALDSTLLASCPAMDGNGSRSVTIDEIIVGVNAQAWR